MRQLFEVRRRQRLIAAQLQHRKPIGVVFQEVTRLRSKTVHVRSDGDAPNHDLCAGADLVFEIGVDDRPTLDLNQLDQRAQSATNRFEGWAGDVLPELLGLNFKDQLQFLRDHWYVGNFLKQTSDGDNLVTKACESRFGAQ
jgi:hypothetical protein